RPTEEWSRGQEGERGGTEEWSRGQEAEAEGFSQEEQREQVEASKQLEPERGPASDTADPLQRYMSMVMQWPETERQQVITSSQHTHTHKALEREVGELL